MQRPFVLFDLDNTLYPSSSGIMQEMNRRMSVFVADYFGVDESEARRLRRGKPALFGTTLQWLRVCHGLTDPEPYIEAVHPPNIEDYIGPDPVLRGFIKNINSDYILFTNSPMEHAERTLSALGIRDLFPRIWDLRRLGYRGKPHPGAYERVLGDLGLKPREALLVDDNSDNLEGFAKLGGQILSTGNVPVSHWVAELDKLLAT